MDEKKFLALIRTKEYSSKELALLEKAVDYAKEILANKKRLIGNSYFDHNLKVGKILIETNAAPEVITAALLNRTTKYVTDKEIFESFGKEILSLVKGAQNITKIKSKNAKLTAEALRKVLLATVRDVRIIIIKLADKLANQKDIQVLPKEERNRISQEILDIYAPLAYRLGLEKIRTALEDLAFRTINHRKYQEIVKFLEESKEDREKNISEVLELIKKNAPVKIIKIKGRTKHIYSIYKKIVGKGVKLNEQYDHLGIRILVADTKDCYTMLGFLHEKFEPIPGRLKDYISHPKPNGYQSIHTALLLDGKKRLEVQIRTPEMDEFAEEGMAAHWRYKGLKSDYSFEKRMAWLKGVLDMQKDSSAREFLENVQVDIFTDEIYCYTPQGDVKYFPLGASVLDFAYSVHEEVGNHIIGARLDGKFVPLRTKLKEGAIVEILTSKNQRPRRNWIKYVVSSRAKQKIRKGVKKYQNLPALHYRIFKPAVRLEHESLAYSPQYETMAATLAKCCLPVPQEEIIGIITKRKLMSVHKVDCRHANKEQERWIEASWKPTFSKNIKFFVNADERSGLLADLLHTIASARFEVREAKAKFIGIGSSQCSFVIVPKEVEEVEKLVKRVKKVKSVRKVFFE